MGKPSRRRVKRGRGAAAQSDGWGSAGAAGRLHPVSSSAANLESTVVSLSLRAEVDLPEESVIGTWDRVGWFLSSEDVVQRGISAVAIA
jgi:hypothetical protein